MLEAADRLGGKVRRPRSPGCPASSVAPTCSWPARRPRSTWPAPSDWPASWWPPTHVPAYVWSGGALHRLPAGLVLGAPAALVADGPLGPPVVARQGPRGRGAAAPSTRRRRQPRGDRSARRFGDEVLERLVGPLVGGINAGDADHLSLRAVTPQLAEAQSRHRSLLLGLRAQSRHAGRDRRRTAVPRSPLRYDRAGRAPRRRDRGAGGGDIRLRAPVDGLEPQRGRWRLGAGRPPRPATLDVDAVVLGRPCSGCRRAARTRSARRRPTTLRSIAYASVAMVTLAVPATAMARPLSGSGYLVPRARSSGRSRPARGAAPSGTTGGVPGQVVLRVSAGRAGDEHALDLDDDDLTAAVLADLDRHVGLRGQPSEVRITRWWRSMPQYAPGHVERIDALMTVGARGRSGPPPGRCAPTEDWDCRPASPRARLRPVPCSPPSVGVDVRHRGPLRAPDRGEQPIACTEITLLGSGPMRQLGVVRGVTAAAALVGLLGLAACGSSTGATVAARDTETTVDLPPPTTVAPTTTTTDHASPRRPRCRPRWPPPRRSRPCPSRRRRPSRTRRTRPSSSAPSRSPGSASAGRCGRACRSPTLDRGPGHWPGTAMPGQLGNVVVGGHRVSHDRPFRNIDQLVPGDEIMHDLRRRPELVHRDGGAGRAPRTTSGSSTRPRAHTATLFACHPPGSTRERYIVFAKLAGT